MARTLTRLERPQHTSELKKRGFREVTLTPRIQKEPTAVKRL